MSTISSGTTTTTALVQTGDTTGTLIIRTGASSTTAMTISSTDQSVNIAKAIQLATGASDLYAADAALSNYASNNGVYLNGNSAGYLRLCNDGTGATKINLLGSTYSTPNQIEMFTAGTERLRITSTGLLQFNSGYGSVATAYGCRAWVNFNGTGTVAIRASGNVTSITDNGTGDYTVNFTTAMPDANYSPIATIKPTSGASSTNGKVVNIRYNADLATGSCRVWCNSTGGAEDMDVISFAVFR